MKEMLLTEVVENMIIQKESIDFYSVKDPTDIKHTTWYGGKTVFDAIKVASKLYTQRLKKLHN
jgi:hypothetical protein